MQTRCLTTLAVVAVGLMAPGCGSGNEPPPPFAQSGSSTDASPSRPPARQSNRPTSRADTLYLRTTRNTHLIAVDAATGNTTQLPIPLGCGDAMFCLVPAGSQLVIGGVGQTSVYDPSSPGRPKAKHLGNGWSIFLSEFREGLAGLP